MEYLVSLVLGAIASWMQGKTGKTLKKWQRLTISILSCVLVSLFVTFMPVVQGGKFDIDLMLKSLGVSFSASQIFYNTYFKPLI